MTRREELEAGMPAPQVIIKMKTGVKRDGTLMALEAEPSWNPARTPARCSPWPASSSEPLPVAELRREGLRGSHAQAEHRRYRAPVAPQTIFAIDSQMEQIAKARRRLVEFRLPTCSAKRQDANNQPWLSKRGRRGADPPRGAPALKKRAEWKASSKDESCGDGLSLGGWLVAFSRPAPRAAQSRRHAPGADRQWISPGPTCLAQIAATAYGVDIDKVKITTATPTWRR